MAHILQINCKLRIKLILSHLRGVFFDHFSKDIHKKENE